MIYNIEMCKFETWITCFIFCATFLYPYKVESARNNAITVLRFPYKAITENLIHNSNTNDLILKSKENTHSLNIQQKVVESTPSAKPSHGHVASHSTSSGRKFYTTKPSTKLEDHINNYITLFQALNFTKSSREDDHYIKKSFPTDFPIYEIKNECYENYDCQQYLKYSTCYRKTSGNECRCLPGYITGGGECLLRAIIGGYCKRTLQCPLRSDCVRGTCVCMNGYVKREFLCVDNSPFSQPPNFLLAIIAGIVFLIVLSCLFVIIMALRRKLRRVRRNTSPDDTPTISATVDASQTISPDPSYQQIDKPPTYDEAMSSSTTLLALNVQDIASEPPSYTQVQQLSRNGLLPSA